jgi:hypothetical protein
MRGAPSGTECWWNSSWKLNCDLHWNATSLQMQISVGVCLYLLRMDGSLPHMNWKGPDVC